MHTLSAVLTYIKLGWSPIPVPHRAKGPLIDAWQDLRINAETAPKYFNGARQNVGVILGSASGDLTDIDLDCPEAIAAAPYILPRTAVFGHKSKPASHAIYQTNLCETQDRAAIKFIGSDKTGLLEVRMGAGGLAAQTVFPPSTHKETGEPIEWTERGPSEIADVDGDELIRRARRLAAASELARNHPKIGGRHDAALVLGGFLARCGWSEAQAAVFVEAVGAASGQPGDKRRDMARTARDGAIAEKPAGFPRQSKSFAEGYERDRQRACKRQPATRRSTLDENPFSLAETFGEGAAKKVAEWLDYRGGREPNAGEATTEGEAGGAIISVKAPYDTARLFQSGLGNPLKYHRGAFYEWDGSAWPQASDDMLRARLYAFLDRCQSKTKGGLCPVKPTPHMVSSVLDALRGAACLDEKIAAPAWLDGREGLAPVEILACVNGLLHLPTRKLLPHTPSFFNYNALDFAYDPERRNHNSFSSFWASYGPTTPS